MASEYYVTRNDELRHFGIKGQRWGVRRFENYDGTLTPEGKERYGGYTGEIRNHKDYRKAISGAKEVYKYNKNWIDKNFDGSKRDKRDLKRAEKGVYKEGVKEIKDDYKKTDDYKRRRAIAIGVGVVGAALVAYGGYKLYKNPQVRNFISKGKKTVEEDIKLSDFKVTYSTVEPDKFSNKDPFTDSINKARNDGVQEGKILKSKKEIDDYFTNPESESFDLNKITYRDNKTDKIISFDRTDKKAFDKMMSDRNNTLILGNPNGGSNSFKTTVSNASNGSLDKEINKALKDAHLDKKTLQKSLGNFKFERAARVDANGKTSYIDLPVDKEGYADAFAKNMAENSKGKSYNEEYKYWYKYIMNKIK